MAARPMPTGFGSFCWQQLNTTDLAAAEAFYTMWKDRTDESWVSVFPSTAL